MLSQLYVCKIFLAMLTQARCSLLQLSWIQQVLSNPDVFCFADYPCHPVVIDLLKTAPEDDNREIATWYNVTAKPVQDSLMVFSNFSQKKKKQSSDCLNVWVFCSFLCNKESHKSLKQKALFC